MFEAVVSHFNLLFLCTLSKSHLVCVIISCTMANAEMVEYVSFRQGLRILYNFLGKLCQP